MKLTEEESLVELDRLNGIANKEFEKDEYSKEAGEAFKNSMIATIRHLSIFGKIQRSEEKIYFTKEQVEYFREALKDVEL